MCTNLGARGAECSSEPDFGSAFEYGMIMMFATPMAPTSSATAPRHRVDRASPGAQVDGGRRPYREVAIGASGAVVEVTLGGRVADEDATVDLRRQQCVVLPEPEGPTIPTSSPALTVRLTPRNAITGDCDPWVLLTSYSSSASGHAPSAHNLWSAGSNLLLSWAGVAPPVG